MIEKKEIEGGIEFNLSGEDVGFVIGRRGETPGLHRHRGRDQRPGGEPGKSDRRGRE